MGTAETPQFPTISKVIPLRYFTFRKDSRKWTGIRMGVNVNKTGRDDFSGDIHPRAAITLPLRADRDNFSVLNTQISLIGGVRVPSMIQPPDKTVSTINILLVFL